ncbi:2-phosphosulfolactate phosphatase [Tessaracoccus sp. MC1865]|uniref:2-phosphosulfolactate phosphatase n=1 Tax=Tessaracoccus sp. MC1865 TaxID=2760310 RepID=UPI0016004029|nr:2-phosphosulfolactate phosphatase [Tessaracoccus sp. MC1865]MBB1483066.1 2-phosphosulfolactate phosphatase [Tessaracoccus sp. MC1865]QTO37504.1 2-phosphosulfolactate phosphatase [Tessaracoccus sp. MC1865]
MNAHARVEPNRPPTIETLHVNELGSLGDDASFDAAVIIDVIRAFTTAPWILLRGASRLFLARDAESAVREGDLLYPNALLVPTEGDEDVALAEYLTVALSTNRAPHPGPFLERVERSPAGIECRDRGTDTRFPGVDPDDLARCLEIDAYDQALLVEEAGELLALSGRLRHQPRAGPYERISRCALSGPRCRRG